MNTSVSSYRRRLLIGTLALAAVGSCPQNALAQTFGWNVDGGGSWITDTNWNPVVVGDWPKDAGDIANLNFNLTAAAAITLDAAISLGALTIGDTNNSHAYTLSNGAGGSLNFDNSGSAATLTETATGLSDVISATLTTAGDLNIVNANTTSGRTFTLSGGLSSSAVTGTQLVTFGQSSANAAVLVSGVIADGVAGGKIALTKTGSGTLTLTQANTYAGATTITGGNLRLEDALGIGSSALSLNGGTLALRNNAATTYTAASATLNANSTISVDRASGTGTGITLTFGTTLVVPGSRTLTTSGANSYTLTLGNVELAGDITFNAGITTRPQVISEDASPRKVIKTGSSLLNIQAASTYSGGTDVLVGVVQFSANGAAGSGLIQVGDTTGSSASEIRVLPGVTVANGITVRSGSSGTSKIARDTSNAAGTGTYSGLITLLKNTTFENASSGGSGVATLDITGQVTGADVKITLTRGGATSSQFVRFSNAANDFGFATATDDAITVGNGVFLFTSDAALGAAGNNATLTGTASSFRGEGTFSTARKVTFNAVGAAVDATPGSELTLTANGQIAGTADFRKGTATGTVVITGDNSARTLGTVVAGGTLRISSAANIGTASAVTLTGGTLSLANDLATALANPISVSAGTSGLNADRAVGGVGDGLTHTFGAIDFPTANPLTFTSGNNYSITTGAVTSAGSSTLTNNIGGTGILTIPSIVQTNAAATVLTLGGTGTTFVTGNLTQGGVGAVGLTKSGAGTATLQGTANSFGGNVAVSGGTLRATHASSLGGGAAIVTITNANSTLDLRSDTALNFAANNFAMNNTGTVLNVDQAVGGSGTGLTHTIGNLSVGGTSNPIISGGNGYGLNANVLSFVDSGGLNNNAPGTVTFASATANSASGETVTFRGTGSTVITGGISQIGAGTFNLTKLDAGSLTINGASTITGNISIGNTTTAGGTVTMGAAGALPNATTLSVLSGTLNMNGFNLSPIAVVMGDGPTLTSASILTGAGTLTLGGNVTYNSEAGHLGASIVGNVALGGATRTFSVQDTTATDPDLTVNGPISDAIGGLIKGGTGQLLLTGTSPNSFLGATIVAGGTLQLNKMAGLNAISDVVNIAPATGHSSIKNLASNQIPDTAVITLTGVSGVGGGHWDLNGFNETIAGLVWNNNQGSGSEVIATGAGTLTVNGNIAVGGTSTGTTVSPVIPGLTGNVIDGNLNLGGAVRTIDVTATGGANLSAAITNGSIIKTGATTLVLGGANTFGSNTDVQAGTLELRNVAALGGKNATLTNSNFSLKHNGDGTTAPEAINFAGSIAISGNATFIADRISTGPTTKTLTIAGLTMAGETVTVTANNSYTFGVVAPLAITASPTFNVTAGTFALIGGASDGGSGFDVFKQGAGIIAFNAASAFRSLSVTGGTVAGTGTVVLYDDFTPLTLRNNTVSANVTLNGAAGAAVTFDATNNGTGTISGQLDLGSAERLFIVPNGTSTPDLNVSGVLTGTTDWSLTGGGRMQLAGAAANTYAGTVTVNSGVLFLAKTGGATAITGNLHVNGGSVLYLDQANDQIADTANVTMDSGAFAFAPATTGTTGNASETLANFTMNAGLFRTAVNTPAGGHSHIVVTGTFTLAGGDFAVNSFSSLAAGKFILNGGTNVVGGNSTTEVNTLAIGAGGLEVTGGQMKMNLSTNAAALGSQIVLGGNVTSFASFNEAGIYGESAPGTFGTRTVDIGAGSRTFTIEDGGALNDFRVDFDITGAGTLVKEGDGTLALNGLIGTGTTSLTANGGIVAIAQSQTLAALVIGAGGTVILNEDLLPAPGGFGGDDGLAVTEALDDFGAPIVIAAASGESVSVAAVPEPGAFGLLGAGLLGLLSRRRRR